MTPQSQTYEWSVRCYFCGMVIRLGSEPYVAHCCAVERRKFEDQLIEQVGK